MQDSLRNINKVELSIKRDYELEDWDKSNEEQDLKAPSKFKSFAKLDEYTGSLDYYLDIRGAMDTQLSYVTREELAVSSVDLGKTYDTLDELYVQCVRHDGTWNLTDNGRVWSEIKTSCFGRPA